MSEPEDSGNKVHEIAEDYFAYLGKHLPHQCASDEFYFLPRSQHSLPYLKQLDDLTPEKIQDHIHHIERLLGKLPGETGEDLEGDIDCGLLRMSMENFLREFRDIKVWRSDPTLYVKIPLIATAQAMSEQVAPDLYSETLGALFSQIPPFLKNAAKNLEAPSGLSVSVTVDMIHDAIRFYKQDIPIFIEMKGGSEESLSSKIQEVLLAWTEYERALHQSPSGVAFPIGKEGFGEMLLHSLFYAKSPKEVLEIALHAYHGTLDKIHALVKSIDNRTDWATLQSERVSLVSSPDQAVALYRQEVEKLRVFFSAQDIVSYPPGEEVDVLETPPYLRSLRATASYRAPLTGRTGERGTFFITPGEEDMELISGHCPYLCAHETYPGHHILDHIRIHHPNPLRRQIESPLFYEGWACYAEQLLDEMGYITDPGQQLIQLERQLWRCLRAILDVNLQSGTMTLDQGQGEIENLGFSSKRAQRQIRRFALTPGYQSCYFLGTYEIMVLRDKYAPRTGLKDFHDILLGGGEIPFPFVEKRLDTILNGAKRSGPDDLFVV
ncbi:DUF885 family protein [Thermodesulfobacteriota bacterium]